MESRGNELACGGASRPGPERTRRILEAVVASAFDVPAEVMHGRRRGPARVALARQVAMYLAHTRLGLPFSRVGALFGRDRTTAAHACRVIEDRRELGAFDALVEELERQTDRSPDLTAPPGVAP